ncbi:hypothetical protein [Pseudoalteromonas sp. HM-SA03]|nr:hypothetical protein [Pseudoalteromonas sp. HM-SA03]
MEFTKDIVALLIENDDISVALQYRFVDEPEVLLNHNYDKMNQNCMVF